jgi:hypothetical protein
VFCHRIIRHFNNQVPQVVRSPAGHHCRRKRPPAGRLNHHYYGTGPHAFSTGLRRQAPYHTGNPPRLAPSHSRQSPCQTERSAARDSLIQPASPRRRPGWAHDRNCRASAPAGPRNAATGGAIGIYTSREGPSNLGKSHGRTGFRTEHSRPRLCAGRAAAGTAAFGGGHARGRACSVPVVTPSARRLRLTPAGRTGAPASAGRGSGWPIP